jgi:hypothetical protein
MIISKPDGTRWDVVEGAAKLSLRARLPGARVFDLATESLRKARSAGLSTVDRLHLALPASWCVNSPAPSTVLRRWALPPQREVWMSLVEVLEEPMTGPLDPESTEALLVGIRALGPEPFGVEAMSKVLALLVPEAVPLMPPPARGFVLGASGPQDAAAFVAMIQWFAGAVREGEAQLESWAQSHREVPLSPAQVLDRLVWFDSEGHRHFPGGPGAGVPAAQELAPDANAHRGWHR